MKLESLHRFVRVLASLLLIAPAASGVFAQPSSVKPGVNRAYQGADYARWQASLETEGREVFERRLQIVDALAIVPGMTVADVGAGTGAFSFLFAEKVGTGGAMIAQDVTPEFIAGIESRARTQGLRQLRTVLGADRDARLAAGAIDLVFTCDTYHHFEFPQAMLASLRAALKPGGRLVVIDYERIPGRSSSWILGHVRAGRETVIAEVEAAGFKLLRTQDFLRENYFLEFGRP